MVSAQRLKSESFSTAMTGLLRDPLQWVVWVNPCFCCLEGMTFSTVMRPRRNETSGELFPRAISFWQRLCWLPLRGSRQSLCVGSSPTSVWSEYGNCYSHRTDGPRTSGEGHPYSSCRLSGRQLLLNNHRPAFCGRQSPGRRTGGRKFRRPQENCDPRVECRLVPGKPQTCGWRKDPWGCPHRDLPNATSSN
jgi:hypothetical protein